MGKYFIVDPKINSLGKGVIAEIEKTKQEKVHSSASKREQTRDELISDEDCLKCVEGRVVVKIDLQAKNYHTFSDGNKIRLERQFNNFNRRETEPVNCYVIDAENIPKGTEIVIHPNAINDSSKIFGYKEKVSDVGYYSIKREECFAYNESGIWKTLHPFETALRIFKPYKGQLEGILPTQLKDHLYVTSGSFKGMVVLTPKACDYELVFQGNDGKEKRLIRFRPYGDEKSGREEEAIAVHEEYTDMVKSGELLIGLSENDCKKLNNTQ